MTDEEFLKRSVGQTVREWRKANGQTLSQLALECGPPITEGYLSDLENNKITFTPPDEKLTKLAKGLHVPVRLLILRSPPPADDSTAENLSIFLFDLSTSKTF